MTISAGGGRSRRAAVLAAMALLAGLNGPHAMAGDEYATIKAEAEKLVAEGSYALAHQACLKAKGLTLGAADQRWLDFRLADTLWRSQAGTQTADSTKYDQARQQLEVLIAGAKRPEDRDRAWCEAQESLADFWWTRGNQRQWYQAWPHYQQALDWWAGAPDTRLARPRYIAIVMRIAVPPGPEPYYYYGYNGNYLPPEIIRSALKIAQADADKACLRYLLARSLQQSGNMEDRAQAAGEFEAVLKLGKTCDWYDDTLYYYGEWMAGSGAITRERNGNWRQESDYVKALELFRRLVAEFQKGETRFHEQAQSQIASILAPSVSVSVPCVYLPGSEVQFQLNWRNMKEISLTLYKVDLTRAVDINASASAWLQAIDPAKGVKVKEWNRATGDKGDYRPGSDTVRLDGKLGLGAYLLTVSGNGQTSRELLLVSDASLLVKSSGRQTLVYLCNALDGSPLEEGTAALWVRSYDANNNYQWKKETKELNADGLAVFDLPTHRGTEFFACATIGDRQAISTGYCPYNAPADAQWRIYAFTDRPAYRPKEKVQWKFLARVYQNGAYSTPANAEIQYEIHDPCGAKLKDGKLQLNAFGAGWGDCDLAETLPLGEYRITFYTEKRRHIGSAMLFRMEEYKLPEFKVSVRTPEVAGRKKTFLCGDKVEVEVLAEYYSGGPVANASVELLVYQNPFCQQWPEPREYPWFYEDLSPRYDDYGYGGQIIKRETLKTDAAGKVTVRFDTPAGSQDWQYRIDARVTDASRREVAGSGTVRVANQRYFAQLKAEHNLHKPGDAARLTVQTLDANDQPFRAEAIVTVTRHRWADVWIAPNGKELRGAELAKAREQFPDFPPPPAKRNEKPWQHKFSGYEQEEVSKQTVKTDATGQGAFTFLPKREGYYQVAWHDPEDTNRPVVAATTLWVANDASADLGYQNQGLEIILDQDTVRPGQTTPVLLCAPASGRYVLFTVEGDDLYRYQLVRLQGNMKRIEIPIEDRQVPNVFFTATMISDRQVLSQVQQVIVPPVQHFLNLTVTSDKPQYEPRSEGILEVTARNHAGQPVAAEVALGLSDESVFYIQKDYAGDPRQFYFGQKRGNLVQTQHTFSYKAYQQLVEGPNKTLVDERELRAMKRQREFDRLSAKNGRPLASEAAMRQEEDFAQKKSGAAPSPVVHGTMSRRDGAKVAKMLAREAAEMPAACDIADHAGPAAPAVVVRTDFRATAFWQADVVTGSDGKASVKVKFPDTLTGWRATARAATTVAQFGIATADMRTRQPLIVRLQAPRFFVVGDKVTLSAVINNTTSNAVSVTPAIQADGLTVVGLMKDGKPIKGEAGPVPVPANGETRVDWYVAVEKPGETRLRVTAQGSGLSDGMEKTYPVYEHGIEKFIARAGKARGNDVTIKLDIPKERKPESTSVIFQVTPSIAVTMLDALPYLAQYPYGCTEQTMSRFLPAIITAKTLKDLGLKPEAVADKLFGGVEPESAAQIHPGPKGDLRKLDDMTKAGLERLYGFQHADGGWGWWKDGDSDAFMTAYVLWGLTLARQAGSDVRPDAITRAAGFLDNALVKEEQEPDRQAWLLHACAAANAAAKRGQPTPFQTKALDNLWKQRDQLNAYTRALLALSANQFGDTNKAAILVRNLENGVKIDRTPDVSVVQEGGAASDTNVIATAHWGEDGLAWRWSDGGIEATAFALRAMLAIDPKNELVEPVMNWLVKNRRGAQWKNTRDTAIVVLAMNDYLRASGELKPDMELELQVNGRKISGGKITADNVFATPSRMAVDRALLRDGTNEFRIVRNGGAGAIYFAVHASFFSLEEPIPPAGNELFVRRQYWREVNRPTLLKGDARVLEPLKDGDTLVSGDRVETVVTIEAKNNYEYLAFEDLKPAGFEAVQLRSGEALYARELKSGAVARRLAGAADPTAPVPSDAPSDIQDYTDRTRWVYQELRDRKVAMFLDRLPEGVWEIRYALRAEVPGQFHALPVLGHAMYVPEIRCNSAEIRVTVEDQPTTKR